MISRLYSQHGSMSVFLAGFIVPLLILLSSAAIDLQAYSLRLEEIQSLADEAALYGEKFLPDTEAAKLGLAHFLHQRDSSVRFAARIEQDELRVKVSGEFRPFFATFFETFLDSKVSIPVAVFAQARAVPLDVFIAFDRGASLSPDFSTGGKETWGDAGEWGSAEVFSNLLTIRYQSGVMNPGVATQQCFNPAFLPIKRAVLQAYDFFSSFRMNRVGIGSFPGAATPVGITADLAAPAASASSFYDTRLDWDADRYVPVEEVEPPEIFPVQSIFCASIAESEGNFLHYLLPPPPDYVPTVYSQEKLIDQISWSVNPHYPLTVRQKIWSRVVNKNAMMDFSLVVAEAEQALFQSGSVIERGGLVNNAAKVVFVVTSRPPLVGGDWFVDGLDPASGKIHELFSSLRSLTAQRGTKLTLYYLLIGGSDREASLLSDLFKEERSFDQFGNVLFEPKVIHVSTALEEFFSRVFTSSMLEQTVHAISR